MHAQDSPIIIDDNGKVPQANLNNLARPDSDRSKNPAPLQRVSTPIPQQAQETHIQAIGGHGIQFASSSNEFFVQEVSYQAVCIEAPDGSRIYLGDEAPWSLTTQSQRDSSVIQSNGNDNNHLTIKPGQNMTYRPLSDMDDPGAENQLMAVVFNGVKTNNRQVFYPQNTNQMFTIHYCYKGQCAHACPDAASHTSK